MDQMVTFNSSVPGTVFAASFHNPPELYDCFLNLFHVQLLPAATKLGQGNIFTGVCLSTGGGLPQCMLGYTPPGADTPPRSRHPPPKQTPAYGQRAAGTHPTGMHSCLLLVLRVRLYSLDSESDIVSRWVGRE